MFKIRVVVVGKTKEKYFEEAYKEYIKRIGRFAEIQYIEVKEENFAQEPNDAEIKQILKKEGQNILKEIKGDVVTLCIEGKKMDSPSFADFLSKERDGSGVVTFVVGGSYGIDPEVKGLSKMKVSFSDMTFPHTLARVMLLEQIYRGFMILSDSRYHK